MNRADFFKKAMVFFLVTIGVALVINRITWKESLEPIIESVIITIIFSMLMLSRLGWSFIQFLPKPHKVGATFLIFCLLFAHNLSLPRVTYPFIPWRMYDKAVPSSDIEYFVYKGTTQNGEKVDFNPELIYTSVRRSLIDGLNKCLMKSLNKEEQRSYQEVSQNGNVKRNQHNSAVHKAVRKTREYLVRDDCPCPETLSIDLNDMFRIIANKYNEQNPQNILHSIEIFKMRFNLDERRFSEGGVAWRLDLNEGK